MTTPPPQHRSDWQSLPLPCIYNRPLVLLNDERCTLHPQKRVLLVANGELVLLRLAELARHIFADSRVQVVFTIPVPRFSCSTRLEELVTKLGLPYISWGDATQAHFDLALSSSALEELPELGCPMLILCHGPGNTKTISLTSTSKNHRDWIEGRSRNDPYRELVLVSEEELGLFPDNVPSTVVGDPVFDALLHARDRRQAFRDSLGVGTRELIVISSTWHDDSLFGMSPDLPRRLLASLPCDRYCVALILHPAIWITHGEWQVRTWLRDELDAGLRLVPYDEGWQAAILAADRVVGDYGSVSLYANMLGIPTCFYRLRRETLAMRLTIAREAFAAPQATSLGDVLRFASGDAPKEPDRTLALSRAFANLGHSIDALAQLAYQRMGLAYDPDSTTPLEVRPLVARPDDSHSFLACRDGGGRIALYPAGVGYSRGGTAALIATEEEPNYRTCQSANGVVLTTADSARWWKERFTTAEYALIRSEEDCRIVDRSDNTICTVGNLSIEQAVSHLAGLLLSGA